jgi:hypothetical protein
MAKIIDWGGDLERRLPDRRHNTTACSYLGVLGA